MTLGADAGLELGLGRGWLQFGGAAYSAAELPGGQLGLGRLHGFIGATTEPAPGWTVSGGLGGAALRWDITDQRGRRESWAPALGARAELSRSIPGPLSVQLGVDGLYHLRELRFDSAATQADSFSLSALLGLHLALNPGRE